MRKDKMREGENKEMGNKEMGSKEIKSKEIKSKEIKDKEIENKGIGDKEIQDKEIRNKGKEAVQYGTEKTADHKVAEAPAYMRKREEDEWQSEFQVIQGGKEEDFQQATKKKTKRGAESEAEQETELGNKQDAAGDKTLEDYLALPEGTRVELIDGVFYDMASPTTAHQFIAKELVKALDDHIVRNKGKCVTFLAPTDVQLDCDDKTMVQPDVLIVCDRNRKLYPWVVGAPDLVVEIVSPGNWKTDVIKKRYKYEKADVREYWMIFPEEQRIEVCLFERGETKEYSFSDKVPVGIWAGKCEVDFAKIYESVRFLYEQME